MLHLYALLDHPAELPPGGALRAVSVDSSVVAVVGDLPSVPTEDAVLEHARVVDELMTLNETVLPARFGGGYADEPALVEAIRARHVQLREAIERIRGCVEVGVRVFEPEPIGETDPAGSGSEYMRRRLASVKAAERVADELHTRLAAGARASACNVLANAQILLSAAYLVPREDVDWFQSAVAAAELARPDLVLVCTGPWPPYSFAMAGEEISDAA
jgi:Gas vesicle synthesis protein GvpL/GvpF